MKFGYRRAQGASPKFLDVQADKHAHRKTDTQACRQARRRAVRSKDRHTHTCRHTSLHTKLKSNTGSYPIIIVAHVSVLEAVVCIVAQYGSTGTGTGTGTSTATF